MNRRSEPPCDPATLVLSGGDNWTGPAVSSYFGGEPMARAMARMGYAATAFGNHDFDFGRERYVSNRRLSGFPFLAANMRATDPALASVAPRPFALFKRKDITIGGGGLATDTTLTTATARNFEGLAFEAEEPALARAIPAAWSAGADAVVLIAHECPDKVAPIVARHPEWKLAFVGAGHCHRRLELTAAGVPIMGPGWRFEGYARAAITVDRSRPPGERVTAVEAHVVEVATADGDASPPADPAIQRLAATWKAKTDQALGDVIGFTSSGLDQSPGQLGRLIGNAWREELGADFALLNEGAIRQAIPKGPITKASIYSVMPFDNDLVLCTLKGSDLIHDARLEEAFVVGMKSAGKDTFVDDAGRPIEPDRKYAVVTIDFLYHGGSGFPLEQQDPSARETGMDWRAPVIDWAKRNGSSAETPIEKLLAPASRPKTPAR